MGTRKSGITKRKSELSGKALLHVGDGLSLIENSIVYQYMNDNYPSVMGYYNYFCDGLTEKAVMNVSNMEITQVFLNKMGVYTSIMPDTDNNWFVTVFVDEFYNELLITGLTGEYQFIDNGSYHDLLTVSYINGLIILDELLESVSNNPNYRLVSHINSKLKDKLAHKKHATTKI